MQSIRLSGRVATSVPCIFKQTKASGTRYFRQRLTNQDLATGLVFYLASRDVSIDLQQLRCVSVD